MTPWRHETWRVGRAPLRALAACAMLVALGGCASGSVTVGAGLSVGVGYGYGYSAWSPDPWWGRPVAVPPIGVAPPMPIRPLPAPVPRPMPMPRPMPR